MLPKFGVHPPRARARLPRRKAAATVADRPPAAAKSRRNRCRPRPRGRESRRNRCRPPPRGREKPPQPLPSVPRGREGPRQPLRRCFAARGDLGAERAGRPARRPRVRRGRPLLVGDDVDTKLWDVTTASGGLLLPPPPISLQARWTASHRTSRLTRRHGEPDRMAGSAMIRNGRRRRPFVGNPVRIRPIGDPRRSGTSSASRDRERRRPLRCRARKRRQRCWR